jgi:putative PEP-CTERM system histidine kinase
LDKAIPILAAVVAVVSGLAALFRRPPSLAGVFFFASMSGLAAECLIGLRHKPAMADFGQFLYIEMWLRTLITSSLLGFSLCFARGNGKQFLMKWKWILCGSLILPAALTWLSGSRLYVVTLQSSEVKLVTYNWTGQLWLIVMLAVVVASFMHLEKTFRTAIGLSRWRIKYVFFGICAILAVKLYSLSQDIIYTGHTIRHDLLNSVTLLFSCMLMAFGHFRAGFASIDLYPSTSVLRGSVTLVVAGGYFILVGLMAKVVAKLDNASGFPLQAMLLLIGGVGFVVLLSSDRYRTILNRFVSRHFRRPEHDYRRVWNEFTNKTSSVIEAEVLAERAADVIAANFHVLGVDVFVFNQERSVMERLAATDREGTLHCSVDIDPEDWSDLLKRETMFDLERVDRHWADDLRDNSVSRFSHGGARMAVPLTVGERFVGMIVLKDRVNGYSYSEEEAELLKCLGDQLAVGFMNASLAGELVRAKELEAFQSVATFFVHDLKNAANSLSLMLQNLPIHFDDPEFRKDAIRAVGRSVERINDMVAKLGALRDETSLKREMCSLSELCSAVIHGQLSGALAGGWIEETYENVPELPLDPDKISSVIANLLMNAHEATGEDREVKLTVKTEGDAVVLRVSDNGSGMSDDFIRERLFRPFDTTKSKGLGIGVFQCKKIIEAHGGVIRVASRVGLGTQFEVRFPVVKETNSL